jgi:hypothetical protein
MNRAEQLPSGIVESMLGKTELKVGYPTDETAENLLCAVLIKQKQWSVFLVAACVTGIYMFIGTGRLQLAQSAPV